MLWIIATRTSRKPKVSALSTILTLWSFSFLFRLSWLASHAATSPHTNLKAFCIVLSKSDAPAIWIVPVVKIRIWSLCVLVTCEVLKFIRNDKELKKVFELVNDSKLPYFLRTLVLSKQLSILYSSFNSILSAERLILDPNVAYALRLQILIVELIACGNDGRTVGRSVERPNERTNRAIKKSKKKK
jgi:hypothetical protein